jgi:hypothetical protein
MPSWLILPAFIVGCTLVVPLFVLGNTGSPRAALSAWWFFAKYMLVLASLDIAARLFIALS